MPIYEYQCPGCSHDFEDIHKVGDPAPPCPECGGAVEKKISLAAFHLKGGGWYSDAYSGKDNKGPGSSSENSSAKPAKSNDSSTGSSDSSSSSDSKSSSSTGSSASSSTSSSGD